MRIILSPDPLLREVCEPVEVGDKSMKRLAKQMIKEMYKDYGVGLAAPQVGVLKRMVVIDTDWEPDENTGKPLHPNPHVLINPEIIEHSEETEVNNEGCLSCPGINVPIERWSWVKVKCLNENYEEVIYEGDELFGRCMQHEIDHLDGKTLFERLKPFERIQALEEYKIALANGAKPGDI